MNTKLFSLDGPAQIGFELEPVDRVMVHRLVKDFATRLAAGFRAIHSRIRIAEQLSGFRDSGTGGNANAHAGKNILTAD